jgi:hypothetical protein
VTDEDFEQEDLDLERRLDAAFSQTRPSRGFEDLLWGRLDRRSRHPAWRGLAGPLTRLPRGAWPVLGGLAGVLVFVLAVLPLLTHGHENQSAGSASGRVTADSRGREQSPAPRTAPEGAAAVVPSTAFGRLPTPGLASPGRPTPPGSAVVPYYGPATLSVIASVASLPLTLPVFRFAEPSTRQATAMAKTYQGQAVASPSRPFREPRMQITVAKGGPGAGAPLPDAAALAAADAFLAGRKVPLPWAYLPEVVDQGPLAFVHYVRQFQVGGYGVATQVDQLGAHAGADVAVRPNRQVLQAIVPLQLPLQSSAYPARASQNAARDALSLPPANPIGLTPVPQVQLSRADLVYVAVQAGAFGYFEPAVLFTGAFTVGGTQYEKRVLVPALDVTLLR